jgi:phosphoserine phosphatase
MLLFKMKVISNNGLKIVGFNLFLRGLKNKDIEASAKAFPSKIKFNKLFKDFDFENKERRIFIISASFEVYLKYCFPSNVTVIGSKYCLSKKRAEKFTLNCYSSTKKKILRKSGIDKIDVFFTDSFSDFSLAEVSKEINVVAGDKVLKMKSLASFKSYFKK